MCAYTFKLPTPGDDIENKAKLMYYLESNDMRVIKLQNNDSQDIYIQSGITTVQDAEDKKDASYATLSMTLYKVSEELKIATQIHEENVVDGGNEETLLPKTKHEIQFKLNKSFERAHESESQDSARAPLGLLCC